MKYTFNVNDNIKTNKIKEKRSMNLYLKVYNFLQNWKNISWILSSFVIYFLINGIPSFALNKIPIILQILLSISISGIIFSILELVFTTEKLYEKISAFIGYDILIKEITVFNDSINDKLKESEIVPGIKIKYDIKNKSDKKFALIFKIDNNLYKVVDILNCDHVEDKIEKNIYSNKILKCIIETEKKCVSEKGILWANFVLLKNKNIKEYDIITGNDIDTSLLLTEIFFFPYIHEKREDIN